MTWAIEDTVGVRWATLSGGRVVPRVVAVGAMAVAVVALQQAAPGAHVWPGLLLLAGAFLTSAAPDSGRGEACLLGYGAWWLIADVAETTVWALVAGLCLLCFHSAAAWAAAGPPGTLADRPVVRRWVADTLAVAAVTIGVWLVVAVLHDAGTSPELLVAAALALLVALGWLTRGVQPPSFPR
jgi:hypothetical protein